MNQFKTSDGKLIEPNIQVFLNTGNGGDMTNLRMLRLLKLLQDSTRCNHTTLQMLYTKTFQVLHIEVAE